MKSLIKNKRAMPPIMGIIIGLIVLAIVFYVIWNFIIKADFKDNIDSEICRQSIVERATLKAGPLEGSELVPLKCKTEKICFTMSGDDCEELISTEDNPVRKVKLSSDPQKAKREIKEEIAETMVDCQSMLGEGQLNFMPHKFKQKVYGLICARFAFDKETKSKVDFIGHGDMYSYLESQAVDSNRNYLEYLYPEWKQAENSIKLFKNFKETNAGLEEVEYKDWKMDLNQDRGYSIIAMLSPSGNWDAWAKGIGTAVAIPVGVGLIASGIGAPVGAVLIGLSGTIGTVSAVSGGAVLWQNYGDDFDYAPPFIYPFDPNVLKNMGIYSFEIAP